MARGEFGRASQAQKILDDAGIPNGVLPGNHDNHKGADPSIHNEFFGPQRYQGASAASATPWYPGLAGILGRERIVGPASMRLDEELLALFVHRCGCPPQRAEVAVGLLTTWVHGRALLGHSDLEPIPGRWLEEFVPEGYPLSSRAQMVDDPQRAELALLLDALFTGCGSTAAGPVHS